MDVLTNAIFLLSIISLTSPSRVTWVPSSSFNLPTNFKDGKMPCSKKTVVFPKSMSGAIGVESLIDVGALILPDDGEIVLENAVIALGQEVGDNNCTDGNSYYLDKSSSAWNQAGVWDSTKFTKATPDAEKIPCYNDDVVFLPNEKFTVRLPDQEQSIASLEISNTHYTTSSFKEYIDAQTDEMAQFVLNEYLQSGVVIKSDTSCQGRFGCPCQKHPIEIDCSVRYCLKPECVAPIKPVGYCCSFCGGYIAFNVDEGFDMISFKELVDEIASGYGETIQYHIGFTSFGPEYKIQLVMVDTDDYIGNSAEAINFVDNKVKDHWFKGDKLFQISGSPSSKTNLGFKLFVSMLFVVVSVFGAIYLFYYRLPAVTFPVGVRRSTGMFSRFQNRSDSVVSLTRRDSTVMATPRTAFRNPLYDSRRGRVQMEEAAVEESNVEDS